MNKLLPPFWSKGNPIDCVGSLNRRNHRNIIKLVSESGNFDALIVLGIFTGSASSNYYKYGEIMNISREEIEIFIKDWNKSDKRIETIIHKICSQKKIPIITVSLTEEFSTQTEFSKIIKYTTPEDAIATLKKLYEYYNK